MNNNEKQIRAKMNSIFNRYGNNKNFVKHLDELPKTIKKLIYNSEELMINLGMLELLPDPPEEFIGME